MRYPSPRNCVSTDPVELLERRRLLSGSLNVVGSLPIGGGIQQPNLIADRAGDLFGILHSRQIFEVRAGQNGLTILADLGLGVTAPDSYYTGLAVDGNGDLFGTLSAVGTDAQGGVYELPRGSSTIKIVALFDGPSGSMPGGDPRIDGGGNLFGTTSSGGANGYGSVWEIRAGSTAITTVASTDSAADGVNSFSSVVIGGDGTIYGIGQGLISDMALSFNHLWKISPGSSVVTPIGQIYGSAHLDGLSGNLLYGATGGTVFEYNVATASLQQIQLNGYYEGNANGVAMDDQGNLFGTSSGNGQSRSGTLFEIPANTGRIDPLFMFDSTQSTDPSVPNGDLPGPIGIDAGGHLFSDVTSSVSAQSGSVFEITGATNRVAAPLVSTGGSVRSTVVKSTLPSPTITGKALAKASVVVQLTNTGGVTFAPHGRIATVGVYASNDGAIDFSSTLIGSAVVHLPPIKASTGHVMVRVPIKLLPLSINAGTYTVLAGIADTDPGSVLGTIGGGPTVNVVQGQYTLQRTDSFASGSPAQPSLNVYQGETFPGSIRYQFENTGNLSYVGSQTLYVEIGGTVPRANNPAGGPVATTLSRTVHLRLQPGHTAVFSIKLNTVPTVTLPITSIEPYLITSGPPDDRLAALDGSFTVTHNPISISPNAAVLTNYSGVAGQTLNVQSAMIYIHNYGTLSAHGPGTVQLIVSPSGNLDDAGNVIISSRRLTLTARPGGDQSVSLPTAIIPKLSAGTYQLLLNLLCPFGTNLANVLGQLNITG